MSAYALCCLGPFRVERLLPQFKEAVAKHPNDALLQQQLGEMLTSSDPAGELIAWATACVTGEGRGICTAVLL